MNTTIGTTIGGTTYGYGLADEIEEMQSVLDVHERLGAPLARRAQYDVFHCCEHKVGVELSNAVEHLFQALAVLQEHGLVFALHIIFSSYIIRLHIY